MEESLKSILASVEDKATSMTVDSKRALAEALRSLAAKIEEPHDTILRIVHTPLELCLCQIGVNSKLFRYLVEAGKPMTVPDLSSPMKAEPLLVGRICRALATYNVISEVDVDTYAATNVTQALVKPAFEAGIKHHFYLLTPVLQELPDSLHDTGYKNPDNPLDCAFSRTYKTNMMPFEYTQSKPFFRDNFAQYYGDYHAGKREWADAVPFAEYLQGWSADAPLFVDVGGAFGGQAVKFRDAVPDTAGRVFLQDQGPTIEAAPDLPGIQKQVIDFFKEQPVKGAKFYYLRSILHDHTDANCETIIGHIKDAMAPESVILVNDMIVPDRGAHAQVTQMDMTMMSSLAALERTERQWRDVLEKRCGLKLKINMYEPFAGDSIIECRLP